MPPSVSALVSATLSGLRCSISLPRTATPMNSNEPPKWLLASSRSLIYLIAQALRGTVAMVNSSSRPVAAKRRMSAPTLA